MSLADFNTGDLDGEQEFVGSFDAGLGREAVGSFAHVPFALVRADFPESLIAADGGDMSPHEGDCGAVSVCSCALSALLRRAAQEEQRNQQCDQLFAHKWIL